MFRRFLIPGMALVALMLLAFALTPRTSDAQATIRYFPETKHTVRGIFLKYWNEHGGLPQQGYPLTEEFQEQSTLDGKTYTVQYFERAIFENHPENKGTPYEVLLAQLGKYQMDSRYPNNSNPAAAPVNDPGTGGTQPPPATQPPASGGLQFSGKSDQVTNAFPLKKGLLVAHSVSPNNPGNFSVELVDAAGKFVALLANELQAADVSAAAHVPADGMYSLKVGTDGDWTISLSQPTATYSAPPAQQTWSGHSQQATALFSLKAGAARFHAVSTNGQGNFSVELLNQDGTFADLLANKIGAADVSTISNIPKNGVYILNVGYDGDWTITVNQ